MDYCGSKGCYSNAKDSYKAGSKVPLYFELIATDTDYSFTLDGEPVNWSYDEKKGIVYYMSTYEDNTPMPLYDAYRYGKQSVFIREYFRINKLLTIAWFGNLNLSNDSPNGKDFQENSFYLSIGPDDVKFNIGEDALFMFLISDKIEKINFKIFLSNTKIV